MYKNAKIGTFCANLQYNLLCNLKLVFKKYYFFEKMRLKLLKMQFLYIKMCFLSIKCKISAFWPQFMHKNNIFLNYCKYNNKTL